MDCVGDFHGFFFFPFYFCLIKQGMDLGKCYLGKLQRFKNGVFVFTFI